MNPEDPPRTLERLERLLAENEARIGPSRAAPKSEGLGLDHLRPGDHRGRAAELVAAAVTANPHWRPEAAVQAAVAEAMLAVADELAALRKLLTERLPEPPHLRLLGPAVPTDFADERRAMGWM